MNGEERRSTRGSRSLSSFFSRESLASLVGSVAKEGTSEGAKLGWETRRHGAQEVVPDPPQMIAGGDEERFSILRAGIEEEIAQETEDLNREAENNRKRIPTDYAGMTRRQAEHGKRGYAALQDVRARLNNLCPSSEEDKVLLGRMLGYVEAKIASSRHGEYSAGERFLSLLSDAAKLSGKLEAEKRVGQARSEAMKMRSIGDILNDVRSRMLVKEGTSEGAKKGWESRKGSHAGYGLVSVPPSQGEQARRLWGTPAKFVGQPKPKEEPKGGKTYPVIYRPGGKGTWGEVRQVTVPPREDEPEKAKEKEDLHVVVRPPIPSKRGANRNVMAPTGEN
jgi:hypothetical protein